MPTDSARADEPTPRELRTAASVFALGFVVSLLGDAGHVLSGTTSYTWPWMPSLVCSAAWFPFSVAGSMLGLALFGRRFDLPSRPRTRAHAFIGVGLVLALYGSTALLRGVGMFYACAWTGSVALAIALWWDRSPRALALGLCGALIGPAAEIGCVMLGAVRYADDSSALWGVAPWLPALYFAACSVASGLWGALRSVASARYGVSAKQ